MTEPINRITLSEQSTDTVSFKLIAEVNDKDDLVLDGYDVGKFVEQWWGDSDYEYWLTVRSNYKDTVLLWLIKERFNNVSEFRAWLDGKAIPSEFTNWV